MSQHASLKNSAPGVRRHIPNSLTVLRLVLAAAFFATLNIFRYPDIGQFWGNIAIGMFVAAAITDALDGALARRWNVISTFGRIMDPFCDKILVLGAFIYLAGPRFLMPAQDAEGAFFSMATGVYPWMVVVIFARELLVTAIRGLVEGKGINFPSKASGKAKMILQSITIPIVMIFAINCHPSDHSWALWFNNVLVWLTVIVTIWSGLPYITGLSPLLKQETPTEPRS